VYQIGVFISRSSINYIQIRRIAMFPILQFANVIILLTQIFFGYIPSIWIIFLIIFWEGLLGGVTYVNVYNVVSVDIEKNNREFAISVVSIADTVGIAIAGFLSIPAHNYICKYGEN
jgi:battenin